MVVDGFRWAGSGVEVMDGTDLGFQKGFGLGYVLVLADQLQSGAATRDPFSINSKKSSMNEGFVCQACALMATQLQPS